MYKLIHNDGMDHMRADYPRLFELKERYKKFRDRQGINSINSILRYREDTIARIKNSNEGGNA